MHLMYHVVALVILIAAVSALYLYRRWLESRDDHYIHLHNDSHDMGIINTQTSMARRLEMLEKLTHAGVAAVILYGLAIAAMAAYSGWTSSAQG